jgi:hypothetical protein
MLLLTAAPSVQEWAHLVTQLEDCLSSDEITGWLDDGAYIESYKLVRQGPGESHQRVTHWTTNQDGYSREELSERMKEHFDCYGADIGDVVGSGNFSIVFECPWDDTKVIKIGHGGMGNIGDIYNDGWLEYALYCMKRQREGSINPLLPTVHKLYVSDCEDWFAALLERYEGTANGYGYTDDMKLKGKTARAIMSRNRYTMPSKPDAEYAAWAKELADDPLFPIVDDIHEGNIMYTSDGRVVITDPSSSTCASHHELTHVMRKMGILPEDEQADAAHIRFARQKRHNEVNGNNIRRMRDREINIPRLVVDNTGVARFDDLPEYANVAMNAMNKLIDEMRCQPNMVRLIQKDNRRLMFGDVREWLAVDPAKPISIRRIA